MLRFDWIQLTNYEFEYIYLIQVVYIIASTDNVVVSSDVNDRVGNLGTLCLHQICD